MAARPANNIGLLRLAFSVLVLFSLCYPLTTGSNSTEPAFVATHGAVTLGLIALDGFFLLSGYLILDSWHRSDGADEFAAKRIRRIYPGYLVALLVTVLVGAAWAESPWTYLRQWAWFNEGLLHAVLFLDYRAAQPGTFTSNPYPGVVNGSLWTLAFLLQCYLMVLAVGVFGLLKRRRAVRMIALAAVAIGLLQRTHNGAEQAGWLGRFAMFFWIGGWASTYRVRPAVWVTALLALNVWIVHSSPVGFGLIWPAAFTAGLLTVAFLPWTPFVDWLDRHDLSYGIYLYAFPVQQILVRTLGIRTPLVLFVAALPVVSLLAFGSWRYVESRFLRRSPQQERVAAPRPAEALDLPVGAAAPIN